jgi:surface polysaccharide O-acyltransferase-like enzyme
MSKKIKRESGIELLKIIAIFIIIVAHMAQGLAADETFDFYINLNEASMQFRYLVLNLFRCLGALGNDIFFICSAWFLVDMKKIRVNKLFYLELDIWIISVTILCAFLIIDKFTLSNTEILDSLFPTITSSYWYTTCYMLMYFISPWINVIINQMTKKELMIASLFFFFVYIFGQTFADFVGINLFFSSRLTTFIALYFIMAFQRKYIDNMSHKVCVGGYLLV